MIATLDPKPTPRPADLSESLRHLVAVAAGLSGGVRLVDFSDGVLGEFADELHRGVDWDGRLLADGLRRAGLAAGGHVVELGCGSGRVGTFLADAGWDVTGIDRSGAAIDRAPGRRPGRRVRWIQANVGRDDVGPLLGRPAVTVVAAAGALGRFLGAADLAQAFSAAAGWLAPDGLAFVVVYDDSVRVHLDAGVPDRLTGHPLTEANGRRLVVWTSLAYHAPTATVHRAALAAVPEPAGLLHHYAYAVERVWTAGEVAEVLGSAGWTLRSSEATKAEGGPADGLPFRLLGFSPPRPAGSRPGAR